MITIRPSNARGHADFGWLDSRHTFSFGGYFDPRHMGFSTLRVINEDKVKPAQGFGTHGHRDMEIISYVLSGGLEHKDSMGNGSVIRPGDVQRMSAGTGVTHSEFNASDTDPVHFLQIWIIPEETGLAPSYEEKHFAPTASGLTLIGSPDGSKGSVTIHQDVWLYRGNLSIGDRTEYSLEANRNAWLQVVRGSLELNGETLAAGDGAKIVDEPELEIIGSQIDAEFLLFDLSE